MTEQDPLAPAGDDAALAPPDAILPDSLSDAALAAMLADPGISLATGWPCGLNPPATPVSKLGATMRLPSGITLVCPGSKDIVPSFSRFASSEARDSGAEIPNSRSRLKASVAFRPSQ